MNCFVLHLPLPVRESFCLMDPEPKIIGFIGTLGARESFRGFAWNYVGIACYLKCQVEERLGKEVFVLSYTSCSFPCEPYKSHVIVSTRARSLTTPA